MGVDRLEVIRLRESRAAAARLRQRAHGRLHRIRHGGGPAPAPAADLDDLEPDDAIPAAEAEARRLEVGRAKRALEHFGFDPELTRLELANILPDHPQEEP